MKQYFQKTKNLEQPQITKLRKPFSEMNFFDQDTAFSESETEDEFFAVQNKKIFKQQIEDKYLYTKQNSTKQKLMYDQRIQQIQKEKQKYLNQRSNQQQDTRYSNCDCNF